MRSELIYCDRFDGIKGLKKNSNNFKKSLEEQAMAEQRLAQIDLASMRSIWY